MLVVDNESTLATVKKETFYKTEEFEDALELESVKPLEAARIFEKILNEPVTGVDATNYAGMKEECVYHLGCIYAEQKDEKGLNRVMKALRIFFTTISKPRSAKILRVFLDEAAQFSGVEESLIPICLEAVQWADLESRTFLRQRIQVRLASLYIKAGKIRDALTVLKGLHREVKKLDDKPLIVEISLLESKAHMIVSNIPKAKSSLTAARSNANAFYCPALLQADIDVQAGEISASEGDFKTACSYFYEAFEAYSAYVATSKAKTSKANTIAAAFCLRRLCLCKLMAGDSSDIPTILSSRASAPFLDVGEGFQIIADLLEATNSRSTKSLEEVFRIHESTLKADTFLYSQLCNLRETNLELNILHHIAPYTRIELPKLARLLDLPQLQVEAKLAELILDKKICAVLDQESGDLIILQEPGKPTVLEKLSKVFDTVDTVVDKLYEKASAIDA